MKIIRESLNNKGITLFRKKISNYDKIIHLKISNKKEIIKHIHKLNNIVILKELNERVKLIEKQSVKISEEIEKERNLISCSNMLQNTINTYKNQRYRDLIKKSLEKEILTIYIRQLLHFNKSKFEDPYLLTFSNIIRKVYGKDVEFNIINLKYIHLNSDTLTQLIALKLRRRKNYI